MPGRAPAASALPSASGAAGFGKLRSSDMDYEAIALRIKRWGRELGFQAVGIADADVSAAEPRLLDWLDRGWHGEMEYMARNAGLRSSPAALKPGTLRVI